MTSPAATARFLEALERQRLDYGRTLPERVAAIDGLWRSIARTAEGPEDSLEQLLRAAHTLAGSGGVFGFGNLGVEARALEVELQALAALCDAAIHARASAIETAISRVKEAIECRP